MTRITTNKNKSTNFSENKGTIERRDFIKLGASGVVAGLAGCAAPGVLTPAVVVDNSANASIPGAVDVGPAPIGITRTRMVRPITRFQAEWRAS